MVRQFNPDGRTMQEMSKRCAAGVVGIVRMGPLSIKRREAAIWCLCPWATILGEPLLFLQLDPKLFLVLAKLCVDVRKLICKQLSTAENLLRIY